MANTIVFGDATLSFELRSFAGGKLSSVEIAKLNALAGSGNLLNAGAGDYYLGEGGRMVTVYVMYVSKKVRHTFLGGKIGLRLMRIVTDWARTQKAEELHIHSTSGIDPERTDKYLRRLGFETYGGNYAVSVG